MVMDIISSDTSRSTKHIGILNMWYTSNYGANLTGLAIQRYLRDLGYTSSLIYYITWRGENERYEESVFCQFAKEQLVTTQAYLNHYELASLNAQFDTFLVGSDQIWRYYYASKSNMAYFCYFANAGKKLISYAASFGVSEWTWPEEERARMRCLLERFDGISVRENLAVDLCRDHLGIEAEWVVDPVFFYDAAWWASLGDESQEKLPDNYAAYYILDMSDEKKQLLATLSEKNPLDITQFNGEKASVYHWLKAIKNCQCFITDSFHGVCFALIFRRPFVVFANEERGASRFTSLLSEIQLLDRLLLGKESPEKMKQLLETPLSDELLDTVFAQRIEHSKRFLRESLEKDCYNNRITYATLLAMENRAMLSMMTKRYLRLVIIKNKLLRLFTWGKKKQRLTALIEHQTTQLRYLFFQM